MPKVSIIIPVYNVEKYLRQCLDSVLAQTLREIEIICVDDGSSDSSPDILKEYAAKDARMQVLTQAIVLAPKIEIVDEILAHQRRNNPDSLSNTRDKSWDCFHTALNALKKTLDDHGIFWQYEQDYINYALHFSLWHLNTITGSKKEVLHQKLKEEWFREFGIEGKPEAYFYNKKEYAQYREIMEAA